LLREATERLEGVLAAAGFETLKLTRRAGAGARGVIERAVSDTRVVATVAFEAVPDSDEVDVWLADSMTHKASVRRVSVDPRGPAQSARQIALQALALLRASLLELDVGASASSLGAGPGSV
jgi:hypothetical protein